MKTPAQLSLLAAVVVATVAHAGQAEDAMARFQANAGKVTPAMEAAAAKSLPKFESTAGKTTAAMESASERDQQRHTERNPQPTDAQTKKTREDANTSAQLMKSPLFKLAGH